MPPTPRDSDGPRPAAHGGSPNYGQPYYSQPGGLQAGAMPFRPQGMQPMMQPHAIQPGMYGMGAPRGMTFQPIQGFSNGAQYGGHQQIAPQYGHQTPQQHNSHNSDVVEQAPPTREEQLWLEEQMQLAEEMKPQSVPIGPEDLEEEPPTPSLETPAQPAQPNDYDDVMKLIEENRRKNEAKRAAQSARNAEIIAAFEQRNGTSM